MFNCLTSIKKYINIHKNDLVIEPSCGNGSFISGIKNLVDNYLFYDIFYPPKEFQKR